ncbi:MAG TPA: cytochrome c [candidate division Zixibacteria bacterium]|nr:cytochrome c [candidate division Zixibacteria bacterium]
MRSSCKQASSAVPLPPAGPARRLAAAAALLTVLGLLISACSREGGPTAPSSDWAKGRAVYVANCVACHNNDPSRDGPIGPAISGSSLELLEARVLRTEYPPGYKPKRNTRVMPTFPFLKSEVPYLAAYLQSPSGEQAQRQ